MSYQIYEPLISIQQNRDRRNDRDMKCVATTSTSFLGCTGSTAFTSTKGFLDAMSTAYSATSTSHRLIKNYSTGIEWYNLMFYTNATTGMVGIHRYYTGTTSTFGVEYLSTAATIPSSQNNYFKFPLGAGEYGDICLSATSLGTQYYHISIQEANGLF